MDAPLAPQKRVTQGEAENTAYQNPSFYQPPPGPTQSPPPPVDSQRVVSQSGNSRVETAHESFYDPSGTLVENQEQVVDSPNTRRRNLLDRVSQIIYFLAGILEVILVLRLFLRGINADSTAGFATFIYNFSSPFVAPFNSIFNNDQALKGVTTFEFSTVLAMVIYALLAFGLVKLLYILFEPNRSSREVYNSSTRRSL